MHFLKRWEWKSAQKVFVGKVFPAMLGTLFSWSLLNDISKDRGSTFSEIQSEMLLRAFVANYQNGPRKRDHVRMLWNVVRNLRERGEDLQMQEHIAHCNDTADILDSESDIQSSTDDSLQSSRVVSSQESEGSGPTSSPYKRVRLSQPPFNIHPSPLSQRDPNIQSIPPGTPSTLCSPIRSAVKPYSSTVLLALLSERQSLVPYVTTQSGRRAVRSARWQDGEMTPNNKRKK